ncbi:flagellar basal-body MS-ring/collar protein FliF [Vibrio sp. MEBiC08052]|uniref:flagellar basal-body MS-ring/collar protein FliF n=1 Tax=Vibrio sp. MEBiC08052 TaxID=1761910 RepID=UPI0007405C26|nr:flagellar basal-body MS-ring/collar protein FliF [Vibrio sp. MEBiC08052]KUI97020.1 hypothetical protein VRK_38750 [Vibrio sp. MEBiC08052]
MNAFTQAWRQYSSSKKFILGFGVVTLLLTASLTVWWLYQPKYHVLFSHLDQMDAAQVTQQLQAMEIPFVLADGGSTIKVDESQVDQTRLNLSAENMAMGKPVGFELFDDADFGLTEFAQKVNYQRALEGELARTITANQMYQQARVHLSIPEKRAFQKNTEQTKASVTVVTVNQQPLNPQQVSALQQLVAASVAGLVAQNVTVLDAQGNSYQPDNEFDVSASMTRVDYQQKLELYLVNKIDGLLTPIFGSGNYQVGVNTALDFDKTHSQRQELTPIENREKGFVKRRVETRDETNQPKVKDHKKSSVEEELDYGKAVIDTESAIGQISRLTVAVVINQKLTAQELSSVQDLIAATVGVDHHRGDVITVKSLPNYLVSEPQAPDTHVVTAPIPPVAGLQHQPTASVTTWQQLFARPMVFWSSIGAVMMLLCLIGFGFYRLARQRKTTARLSISERETLLKEVEDWLKIEDLVKEKAS